MYIYLIVKHVCLDNNKKRMTTMCPKSFHLTSCHHPGFIYERFGFHIIFLPDKASNKAKCTVC